MTSRNLTKPLGTKVTPAMYDRIRFLAAPKSPSEWLRDLVTARLDPEPVAMRTLAEVIALSRMVSEVLLDPDGPAEKDAIRAHIATIDREKFEHARQLIEDVA